MMEKGYNYVIQKYIPIGPNENGEMDFYISSSTATDTITPEDVEKFRCQKYRTFEEFSKQAFRMWKVTFKKNINDWKLATCTCPDFDANYLCKHMIAMAIDLGAVPPKQPEELNFDDEPLFPVTQGRPKSVKPGSALQIE